MAIFHFCPECGAPLAANTSVCRACGKSITGPSSFAPTTLASSSSPQTPSPTYFTPAQPPVSPVPPAPSFYGGFPYGSSPYGSASPSYAPPPPVGVSYAVPFQEDNKSPIARARPLGVTLLAVLVGLQGMDDLFSAFFALTAGNPVGFVFVGLLAIVALILLWGLWKLRPWAFWTAIVVEVIYLLLAPFSLPLSQNLATVIERMLLELVIPLVVLICLFAIRKVRSAIRGK